MHEDRDYYVVVQALKGRLVTLKPAPVREGKHDGWSLTMDIDGKPYTIERLALDRVYEAVS